MKAVRARAWIPALALLMASPAALAGWTLDAEASSLSFVSIKNDAIAEVHHFTGLSGTVSDEGIATLTIGLASVETGIPIRNERMQKLLFETSEFAEATASLSVDMTALAALGTGEDLALDSEVSLKLHGISTTLPAKLLVTRLGNDRYRVATVQPVIVSAPVFKLAEGIEALREVAGLKAIGTGVPVTLLLTFAAD